MKCSATTANFKNVACKFQKLSHWGIPGVLAVDVCKGFAVTMMCLSCEKCSVATSSASMCQTCGWQSKVSKKQNLKK